MLKRSVTVLAPAKLNLSLDVVGTLPNGYHDLDMVMQTIDLYEKITLRRSNDLTLTLPGSFVPAKLKVLVDALDHGMRRRRFLQPALKRRAAQALAARADEDDRTAGFDRVLGIIERFLHLIQIRVLRRAAL